MLERIIEMTKGLPSKDEMQALSIEVDQYLWTLRDMEKEKQRELQDIQDEYYAVRNKYFTLIHKIECVGEPSETYPRDRQAIDEFRSGGSMQGF